MATLELGDTPLYYTDQGNGPAVIFIHGFPLTSALWQPQVDAFVAAGYRVIVPDLRGFGQTPVGQQACGSMATYVQDLEALVQHLQLSTAAWVGLSMGGYILLELLAKEQAPATAGVLCFTRAGAESPEGRDKRDALIQRLHAEGPEAVQQSFAELLLSPAHKNQPSWQQRLQQVMGQPTTVGMQQALEAMRDRQDSSSWLADIHCPCLVVCGAEDQIMPRQAARDLAAGLPQGRCQELAGVGHLGNLEASDAFNQALLSFLQQAYPPAAKGSA